MAVTSCQDLPLADRDREWDGDAAERRVRQWAKAEDAPNERYRDARGGVDSRTSDADRARSHLAKYYRKIDDTQPWEDNKG